MSSNIVITMARQYGSGGKTIGAMLAKELGINCYSREILRMASEESGINERLFGMSDEKMKGAGIVVANGDEWQNTPFAPWKHEGENRVSRE